VDLVYNIAVVTHLLGMAALVGGYLAGQPAVNEVMVWGARAQLITGIALAGMAESIDSLGKDPNMTKIGVKLLIAVVVTAFAEMGRGAAKRGRRVVWMTHAAGALAIVNVLIATLWT
jgi:hypothetical protein